MSAPELLLLLFFRHMQGTVSGGAIVIAPDQLQDSDGENLTDSDGELLLDNSSV